MTTLKACLSESLWDSFKGRTTKPRETTDQLEASLKHANEKMLRLCQQIVDRELSPLYLSATMIEYVEEIKRCADELNQLKGSVNPWVGIK